MKITLDNQSVVDGTLSKDSEKILALRQELGLIEYVSINADDYNWSSFRDGIEWASGNPDAVAANYKQGGLWDDIRDLPYETYLPQTQMAISATADVEEVTITATHAATGMSDTVTVNVNTLRDKFYLFQVTPAETTTVTYTSGSGETRTLTTNADGLLAVYESDGIASDVQFRSGTESDPYLGTISQEALSSGERDAAKLQLYPLNTITLVPAARAELYLVKPDGTPYANQTVTLRGGVYLGGYYCEDVTMRATSTGTSVPGNRDNTYTTNDDGMLTVYMDATQFNADGYTGQLTNAALDYWFELRDLGSNNEYYPVLVNIQGSMSADHILRTGSAVVMLESVPDGEEEKPYLTAQTLSYGEADGSGDLKVRSVLGSAGTVGPNSTYQYAELTSYFMLWGVNNDDGQATVTMTGENGFAPAGQTVEDSTFPFASIPVITNTMVLTKETMTDSGWLQPETAETLRASVYQNGTLVKQVTMPFRVIDLTDVQLVNVDASALILEMQGSFVDSIDSGDSKFTFGDNRIGNIFSLDIQEMLEEASVSSSPLFKVLITPSEDNSVFNVLIWGGYNSLDLNDFDYDNNGLSMDYELLNTEVDFGVPAVNDLSDMAKGTFDPSDAIDTGVSNRTNSSLDFGAQLEGYYEGQFYYDVDNQEWAFRATGGGFTAGASVSFQGNVNAWVGPIPITVTFGAGIALQLDFKTATMYTDQQSEAVLATWTDEAQNSASVSDYLTTLRLNGYVNAFGGLGFDYCVLALKIGLFGQLTGDSTNRFLSRTYLTDSTQQQINGQGLGVSGEVGIKFVAKFLFISYEAVIGSGSISYSAIFNDWDTIDNYWNGSGSVTGLQMSAPTLLSRDYLAAYANGTTRWNSGAAQFSGTASVVQDDANPGSEPAVNDDGSLSVYISDMDSDNYFDSRIMAGSVGTEGTAIDDDGYGDMSPSLSGNSDFTVAAWIRLFENLEDQEEGEALAIAQQKQLLNSTEIMVATTSNEGTSWTVEQLTDNATPDLAPVTASSGSDAVVFWRSVYASDEGNLLNFDTQNAIYYSRYDGSTWSEAQMVYNGSIGNVVGIQASMLPDGTAIVAFTVDRDPDNDVSTDYEMAYRVVQSDGTLGDLVVLTSDEEIDTNPQAAAVSADGTDYFVLAWYSTQDGGDVRLQAVGSNGELYSGGSDYAVPASVKAVSQEENLVISSDFRFAKRTSGSTIDGLTLVWAETANNDGGAADHSVLYGTQLSRTTDGSLCLFTPQALITLPDRTLSNSFSAWQSGSTVNAYIFGTWYSPTETEQFGEISVPVDTDRLLTGGGTMVEKSVSVDSIAVDYATLQTNSFTPVVFTVRNTGTAALEDVTVAIGNYSADSGALNPGESASVTVMYKTGDAIDSPTYTVTSDSSSLVSDTLHLDYDDLGISNIKVVDESEGQRTILVTLYNDAAAKLEGSERRVKLSFYTDSEYSDAANVTLSGTQTGVSASGNTITIQGDDALRRIDQGSMTLMLSYDLKSHVNNTLGMDEIPASGVYLYATASVTDNGSAMAEYATGNNSAAVLLTGAYARTGEKNSMDVDMDNSSGATEATVTLKNNSLQNQSSNGTLLAVLLDENGGVLETMTVAEDTALTYEETKRVNVQFGTLGSDVILLYASADSTDLQLQFSGMNVDLDDFVENADGNYVYTLPDEAPSSTVVTFISDSEVTVNGTEYDRVGSAEVTIPTGSSSITVTTGGKTYTLYLYRSGGTGGNTGGGGGGGSTRYTITVEDADNGSVSASASSASYGTTITITVTPDDGYELSDLIVTDANGNEISVTMSSSTRYTFTMPRSAVTVEAFFVEIENTDDLVFTDVPSGSYYYDAVYWVVENGVTNGTSATTFSPNVSCTRAQMVTFLWRAAGSPEPETTVLPFTDVSTNAYYYDAVLWAVENGITNGTSATTFSPDATVTRAQTVTFLWRYDGSQVVSGSIPFTDVSADAYYADAVLWAVNEGITVGTSTTTFSPNNDCTRAQIVTFLYRYMG